MCIELGFFATHWALWTGVCLGIEDCFLKEFILTLLGSLESNTMRFTWTINIYWASPCYWPRASSCPCQTEWTSHCRVKQVIIYRVRDFRSKEDKKCINRMLTQKYLDTKLYSSTQWFSDLVFKYFRAFFITSRGYCGYGILKSLSDTVYSVILD